jgi:RNA polymerase sigma-70 factor (ECF subfamily)
MAGDMSAFEGLVRAYQGPVFRFLRNLLGDATLAEDVTQETFIRAYERRASFRFDAAWSTWVFQIARNAGLDAVRSRTRRLHLVDRARPPAPRTDPTARIELDAALASLSPKLREAVLVVEVLGMTYREAAEVLHTPEGTVKSRVFQARQHLLAWMQAEEPVDDA